MTTESHVTSPPPLSAETAPAETADSTAAEVARRVAPTRGQVALRWVVTSIPWWAMLTLTQAILIWTGVFPDTPVLWWCIFPIAVVVVTVARTVDWLETAIDSLGELFFHGVMKMFESFFSYLDF